MQVRKASNAFEFDFTFDGRRIRRTVDCVELVHFLEGGSFANPDSNLPDEAKPITFLDFSTKFYLPLHSKAQKKPNVHHTDQVSVKALARHFGDMPIHRIAPSDWEEYKRLRMAGTVPDNCRSIKEEMRQRTDRRLPLGRPASHWTINRELSCMTQVLIYALGLRFIKENRLSSIRRLPAESRSSYWLKKDEIERYLAAIAPWHNGTADPDRLRRFGEFLVLTGARIGEGLLFNERDVDWTRREVRLVTFKKRKKRGREAACRYLSIDGLGPRFIALLGDLKAHPASGFFFAGRRGKPFPYPWLRAKLVEGARKGGISWFRPHDSRHTFAMHRAIVVKDFRQLQMELGHEDPVSVQSYLDNTARFRPEDSIFYRA